MYDPERMELKRLIAMSPVEKVAVMNGLIGEAYNLKEAWVRAMNPDMSDQEVYARVRALVSGAQS